MRNIFLLENLELEFKTGLTVLTGETGAGKSILLDCLGFTWRKNTKIEVGKLENTGHIIGEFQVNGNYDAQSYLNGQGIETTEDVIIRQQINKQKKEDFY